MSNEQMKSPELTGIKRKVDFKSEQERKRNKTRYMVKRINEAISNSPLPESFYKIHLLSKNQVAALREARPRTFFDIQGSGGGRKAGKLEKFDILLREQLQLYLEVANANFWKFPSLENGQPSNVGKSQCIEHTNCSVQPWHMDITPDTIPVFESKVPSVPGRGKGVSLFVGMEQKNFLWVCGGVTNDFEIINPTLVEFGCGDVLCLPYGVIHAGVANKDTTTYKAFLDVADAFIQENDSQVWIREKQVGTEEHPAGYYTGKQWGSHTDQGICD